MAEVFIEPNSGDLLFKCDCHAERSYSVASTAESFVIECFSCHTNYRVRKVGWQADRLAKFRKVKPGLYEIEESGDNASA